MKQQIRRHSTLDKGKRQDKKVLIDLLPQCIYQPSNHFETDTFNKLTKCLNRGDNPTIIGLLKEHPELIYRIDHKLVIRFPPMGLFRIFFIAGKYLLYKGEKYIFSSYSRDVAERNQKVWYHHYEQERKITKRKNPPHYRMPAIKAYLPK